jgi:transcriptional regulator with XRE-family HTH domain
MTRRATTPRGHHGEVPFRVLVGQRVRDLRLARGLSQRGLAERLGFSASRLSKYESGAREMPLETMVQLGHVLEVQVDAMVSFEPAGTRRPLDGRLHDLFMRISASRDDRLKEAAIAVLDMVFAAHELSAATREWGRAERT